MAAEWLIFYEDSHFLFLGLSAEEDWLATQKADFYPRACSPFGPSLPASSSSKAPKKSTASCMVQLHPESTRLCQYQLLAQSTLFPALFWKRGKWKSSTSCNWDNPTPQHDSGTSTLDTNLSHSIFVTISPGFTKVVVRIKNVMWGKWVLSFGDDSQVPICLPQKNLRVASNDRTTWESSLSVVSRKN